MDEASRAEVANRVALHVARIVEKAIASLGDKVRVERGLELDERHWQLHSRPPP